MRVVDGFGDLGGELTQVVVGSNIQSEQLKSRGMLPPYSPQAAFQRSTLEYVRSSPWRLQAKCSLRPTAQRFYDLVLLPNQPNQLDYSGHDVSWPSRYHKS